MQSEYIVSLKERLVPYTADLAKFHYEFRFHDHAWEIYSTLNKPGITGLIIMSLLTLVQFGMQRTIFAWISLSCAVTLLFMNSSEQKKYKRLNTGISRLIMSPGLLTEQIGNTTEERKYHREHIQSLEIKKMPVENKMLISIFLTDTHGSVHPIMHFFSKDNNEINQLTGIILGEIKNMVSMAPAFEMGQEVG